MKRILLDTNAYTHYLTGDEKVLTALADAETVYMSIFVLGELYAGFKGGNREEKNIQLLQGFLKKAPVNVLRADERTAEIFGDVKNSLKRAGTPLPINDVWIAAHTIETDSILITYDDHFNKIKGINLWQHLNKP